LVPVTVEVKVTESPYVLGFALLVGADVAVDRAEGTTCRINVNG
jgi:hypothetical protein